MTDKDQTPITVTPDTPSDNAAVGDNGAGQSEPVSQNPVPSAGWIEEGGAPSSLPQTIIAALKG